MCAREEANKCMNESRALRKVSRNLTKEVNQKRYEALMKELRLKSARTSLRFQRQHLEYLKDKCWLREEIINERMHLRGDP